MQPGAGDVIGVAVRVERAEQRQPELADERGVARVLLEDGVDEHSLARALVGEQIACTCSRPDRRADGRARQPLAVTHQLLAPSTTPFGVRRGFRTRARSRRSRSLRDAFLLGLAQDLARLAHREQEADRVFDRRAEAHLGVDGLEHDVGPARALEDRSRDVRLGHRERARDRRDRRPPRRARCGRQVGEGDLPRERDPLILVRAAPGDRVGAARRGAARRAGWRGPPRGPQRTSCRSVRSRGRRWARRPRSARRRGGR